jgi:hypothetical protein
MYHYIEEPEEKTTLKDLLRERGLESQDDID